MQARIAGVLHTVEVNVTGLAGFLLAKTAAAHSRRKPKDWYDIAFVLLHNNARGVTQAASQVLAKFGPELVGPIRTALEDLQANFADPESQGPQAYTDQMLVDHPQLDAPTLHADQSPPSTNSVGSPKTLVPRTPEGERQSTMRHPRDGYPIGRVAGGETAA